MTRRFVLQKDKFSKFFDRLKTIGVIYAPVSVSKKSYAYKEIENCNEIAWESLRTILPPKKFFYPQSETLVEYDKTSIRAVYPEEQKKVIFGVHPCDLAAISVMDLIFQSAPADANYHIRRSECFIVGLSCMPDEHCFCKAMGCSRSTSNCDIFLTVTNDSYIMESGTDDGEAFLSCVRHLVFQATPQDEDLFEDFWSKREVAFANDVDTQNLEQLIENSWTSSFWSELGSRCLSCGNCTPVCPTCYCFDMLDFAELQGDRGGRKREWDSCQFAGFAQVAGGENFRATPADRLKIWYYHKLHGFDDAAAFRTCVGCGRCTVSCPSDITQITKVILQLQSETDNHVADKV